MAGSGNLDALEGVLHGRNCGAIQEGVSLKDCFRRLLRIAVG
jgi:hypothetical protein